MSTPSDLQSKLAQQATACGWNIVKTVALGIAAGALALYGQHSLSAARPIFPFIEQNFGMWQGAYVITELVIGLVCAAAILQKINLFQESLRRLSTQKTVEEQKEIRAQKRAEAQRAELKLQAKKNLSKTARSAKFDY